MVVTRKIVKWLRKHAWWVFGALLPLIIWGINYFFSAKSNQSVIKNNGGINVQRDIKAEGGGDLYVTGKGNFYITKYKIPPEQYEKLTVELGTTQSLLKDLQARLTSFDSTDPEIISLKRQAKEALDAKDFEKAKKLLGQASQKDIDAAKQLNENANKRLLSAAESKAQIGTIKYIQSDYKGALTFYREAVELVPSGYKPLKVKSFLAVYLEPLGIAANNAGYFTDAEKYLKRCIKLRMRILGMGHKEVDKALISISNVYLNQDKYSAAKPILERSLRYRIKSFGPKHFSLVTPLNNLAIIYHAQGKFNEAESLYKRSLTICENLFGSESIVVAASLNNLAIIYHAQGKVNEAKTLRNRALLIYKNALGLEYPHLLSTLNALVLFDDADDRLLLNFRYKTQHIF